MKRYISLILFALFISVSTLWSQAWADAPQAASGAPTPTDATTREAMGAALFKRMEQINAGLRSYKADLHIDVALKTFLPLNESLDGSVYYKDPDKQAVVFDAVPALAEPAKKLYARIEPPKLWSTLYYFELLEQENGNTTFRLVPRKHGRVAHLDVKVDDVTATIRGYIWTYEDGGFVSFDQSMKNVGGNYLVEEQVGHVELPSWKAEVKSSLSNYRLNFTIDDGVFQKKE